MTHKSAKTRARLDPVISSLNAYFKSAQTTQLYRVLRAYYACKPLAPDAKQLLSSRSGPALARIRDSDRPTVYWLGTDEHQDTSGILQGLERIADTVYFTNPSGFYGQSRHAGESADVVRANNAAKLLEDFEALAARNKTPHVLIGQMWSHITSSFALDEIRNRYGTLVVNVCMDDRHAFWKYEPRIGWLGTRGLAPHVDLAAVAAPECVQWHLKEGCPARFMPEASHPEIFRPMPERPKTHDLTFVGANYGVRSELVHKLRQAGLRVTTFGSGWPEGRLATEDVPRLFAESKIILGSGAIGRTRNFVALKMRDFDGPMSGSAYLTQANDDLNLLYTPGIHLETYRDIADCVRKARLLLSDPSRLMSIAKAGRAHANRYHTWERRFLELFNWIRSPDHA